MRFREHEREREKERRLEMDVQKINWFKTRWVFLFCFVLFCFGLATWHVGSQ